MWTKQGGPAADEFQGAAAVNALCRSGLRGTAAVDELRGVAAVSALWRNGLRGTAALRRGCSQQTLAAAGPEAPQLCSGEAISGLVADRFHLPYSR